MADRHRQDPRERQALRRHVNCPVPGTTVLVPVNEAGGWAQARPDVRFAGYLVTARRVAELPQVTAGPLRRPQLVKPFRST
ncbi:DUF6578 domain-containing protein [Streptomyces sp. NPDC056632]|uniref:DUF6578 domain-containing protein n=1 Tax=Streptomyces sp. NPDC056632 TaxID=3345884 RepID=UPI0036BC77D5